MRRSYKFRLVLLSAACVPRRWARYGALLLWIGGSHLLAGLFAKASSSSARRRGLVYSEMCKLSPSGYDRLLITRRSQAFGSIHLTNPAFASQRINDVSGSAPLCGG